MCGIAGWLAAEGASVSTLRSRGAELARSLAHRGPDDEGIWSDETAGIVLAHRRLSIIDLSPTGHQPMIDASGRFVITYNGEIYNYRDLRKELEAQGGRLRGNSDTEVLLEFFAREGEAMLAKLKGIFAFAIWDLERRQLFLARDALGVKPLYYTYAARGFAFASELKALVPLLTTDTLDVASLHRYLTFLWCPAEGTPLKEVRKFAPGEVMIVRDGRISECRKWYELPARRGVTPVAMTENEAVHDARMALRTAVQRQMVADVPVGAFLSGGLDSSSIVVFAREVAPALRCFTIDLIGGHDAGFANDLPYARRVAAHLGVQLEVVCVEASHMAQDLEEMVWQLDEPLVDPAPLNVRYISHLAHSHGIRVLLSGAGGDDLFSGYHRHLALSYEYLWTCLPRMARGWVISASMWLGAGSVLGRRLKRVAPLMALDNDPRLAAYFSWQPEDILRGLYSADFLAMLKETRAEEPFLDFLAGIPTTLTPLERMLALEQRFFLADHNLIYTDRMSMAEGVEGRVPFLDLDLVEYAASVPQDFKLHGRTAKWVLKRAMEPYLPREIIYRPKTGFGAPLRRWLHRELRPLMDELLSDETLKRRGLFNPGGVRALREADTTGRVDASYTLFGLMVIEIWCRKYLDAKARHNIEG